MNIFVINYSVEACGAYQYCKRVGNILRKSKNHNFIYLEINSYEDLEKKIQEYNPKIMIYNYLNGTMPWVTESNISSIREKNIKQFLIVHNQGYSTLFDCYLHQDPYWKHTDDKNFSILRPLSVYEPTLLEKRDDIIRIGSFGFGLINKYYDEVCRVVNEQFDEEKVELRLHLTHGTYAGENQQPEYIIQSCKKNITKPNINLTITTDFLDDEELLDFLASNDLNVFFYQDYYEYNGISSVIDYALAVKKPIAINKSSMFSHILDVEPSICVEDNYLIDIIKNGFDPLQKKYDSWSNENFIHKIETIMESVI